MKSREAKTKATRNTEFLDAVQALHHEGYVSPTMAAVQARIMQERANEMPRGRSALYRAGVRLCLIDISEEATATRQRLEHGGRLESAQEASLLATVCDRPPAMLVRIPQEPLIETV